MKPGLFLALAIGAAIVLAIATRDRSPDSGDAAGTDVAAARALRMQQCMGVVDANVSLSEYAQRLRDQQARTGIDVEQQQAMAAALAEQRSPGITKRCAAMP